MNISFRQLQTFVQVMRTGSVSEAGRSLGRTQPAISAMIASLEREVGFALFERERGRLIANPEAYYFLEEAEIVLDRLFKSTRTLRDIGNLKEGKLKIACNPVSSSYFMPKVLGEFLKDKPDVEASFMMRSSPVVADLIASQQYDIGFAETMEPRGTIRAENFPVKCLCALNSADPLVAKPVVTPADLHDRPMALLIEGHTMTVQIQKAFHDAGARLRSRFELRTFVPALQLVSQGLCSTVCDGYSSLSYEESYGNRGGVVFKPFKPDIMHNMSLMMPANRPLSRLALSFAAELRNEVTRLIDTNLLTAGPSDT